MGPLKTDSAKKLYQLNNITDSYILFLDDSADKKSCCGECFDLDGKYAQHTATLSLFFRTLCTAASMSSAQVSDTHSIMGQVLSITACTMTG